VEVNTGSAGHYVIIRVWNRSALTRLTQRLRFDCSGVYCRFGSNVLVQFLFGCKYVNYKVPSGGME
jgi:hypothetical protein